MGANVAAALRQSIDCLRRQDTELARVVIDGEDAINRRRRALEQLCLVVLAAHKPAGRDLRVVGATLELATELERIADYAVDTARNVIQMGAAHFPAQARDLVVQVADVATAMVSETLDAYGHDVDEPRARVAASQMRTVADQVHGAVEAIIAAMQADPATARAGVLLLWTVRDYQRAACRATNIAERVIYIATERDP